MEPVEYISFIVVNQDMERTDRQLVAESAAGTIAARFDFSDEWANFVKIARFTSALDYYDVEIEENAAVIPSEVLKFNSFTVSVYGTDGNGYILTSDKVTVPVERAANPNAYEPTPALWERTVRKAQDAADSAAAAQASSANAETSAQLAQQSAADAASSAASSAESAQSAAAGAGNAAGAASAAATSAESAAASAQASADNASSAAQDAASASTSAQAAAASAESAQESATSAQQSAADAASKVNAAATSAANAETSAQESVTSAAAAQASAEDAVQRVSAVEDEMDGKADIDGYYEMLTAGAADNLTGRGDGVGAEYIYRTAGGTADIADGAARIASVKGNAVVWNQLAHKESASTTNGVTITPQADGTFTISGTATDDDYFILGYISTVSGHKYLLKGCPAGGSASTYYYGIAGAATDTGSGGIQTGYTLNTSVRFLFKQGVTFDNVNTAFLCIDLTRMFGQGNEPATVAEFEALYPDAYYPYDAGTLLPVRVEGIETVGFNAWDEEWEVGGINQTTGANTSGNDTIRSKNYIPVLSGARYYFNSPSSITVRYYDADKNYIGAFDANGNGDVTSASRTRTMPANCAFMRFSPWPVYGTTYNYDICINLSHSGYRNGEYEPYWQSTREVPVATYFPDGMKSAGTVRDELTAGQAVKRVGAVDLGTLSWNTFTGAGFTLLYAPISDLVARSGADGTCEKYTMLVGDYQWNNLSDKQGILYVGAGQARIGIRDDAYTDPAAFKAAVSGVMLYYELATPTTTEIDPPLNLDYKVSDFGTERIVHTEPTAPVPMDVVYGVNAIDTIRRLPKTYISHESFARFIGALETYFNVSVTETWDADNSRYNYSIAAASTSTDTDGGE